MPNRDCGSERWLRHAVPFTALTMTREDLGAPQQLRILFSGVLIVPVNTYSDHGSILEYLGEPKVSR